MDIVNTVRKVVSPAKLVTAHDHIKAVDAALVNVEEVGLERFLPHHRLEPGAELVLAPAKVTDRPVLVYRGDQLYAGFAGMHFLTEVAGLRMRCAWEGAMGEIRSADGEPIEFATGGVSGPQEPHLPVRGSTAAPLRMRAGGRALTDDNGRRRGEETVGPPRYPTPCRRQTCRRGHSTE